MFKPVNDPYDMLSILMAILAKHLGDTGQTEMSVDVHYLTATMGDGKKYIIETSDAGEARFRLTNPAQEVGNGK